MNGLKEEKQKIVKNAFLSNNIAIVRKYLLTAIDRPRNCHRLS